MKYTPVVGSGLIITLIVTSKVQSDVIKSHDLATIAKGWVWSRDLATIAKGWGWSRDLATVTKDAMKKNPLCSRMM